MCSRTRNIRKADFINYKQDIQLGPLIIVYQIIYIDALISTFYFRLLGDHNPCLVSLLENHLMLLAITKRHLIGRWLRNIFIHGTFTIGKFSIVISVIKFILTKPADQGALSQGPSDKNKPQTVLNLFAEFTGSWVIWSVCTVSALSALVHEIPADGYCLRTECIRTDWNY